MTFSYPAWFIALALLCGAGYAAALYFRDRKNTRENSSFQAALPWLAALRFVTVSILALLLLDPVLRYQRNESEKPILLVALDNSASLALGPDSGRNRAFAEQWQEWKKQWEDRYDVQAFRFGSTLIEETERDAPAGFDEPATDLSGLLDGLANRYAHRNIGALVLASDGIYNLGNNPAYGNASLGVPVYTIGLGDTTRRRDLSIDRSYANRLVYLNDRFTVRLDLSALHARGEQAPLRLEEVSEEGQTRTLESRVLNLDADPFAASAEFIVSANKAGVLHLRAVFGPLKQEATDRNNTVDLFIEVLDSRQRILLLAHAPHPDLAAFRQVMEQQGNYVVDVQVAGEFYQESNADLSGVDLLILHQLPSTNYPISDVLAVARSQQLPVLYVLGARTDLEQFSKQQDLLRIRAGNGSTNEVLAKERADFSLFQTGDNSQNTWKGFPPLYAPFGDYRSSPQLRVLLTQRIGSVDTEYPLLAFAESSGARTGILAAEGIYRWRLFDYMESGRHDRFDELFGKCLQYLSVKSDKRNFRTMLAKQVFSEQENIAVQAELYNASYEPITAPDVRFTAQNEEGKRYEYRFNRDGKRYVLQAGALPAGQYRYTAQTELDGKTLTSEGRFTVAPLQLEALDVTARHGLLASLSSTSGGAFFQPDQLDALADSLRANDQIRPVLHASVQTRSVIHLQWIFFGLLLLLSVEWLWRKLSGTY